MTPGSPDPTINIKLSATSLKEKEIPQEMRKRIELRRVKLYSKGYTVRKSVKHLVRNLRAISAVSNTGKKNDK